MEPTATDPALPGCANHKPLIAGARQADGLMVAVNFRMVATRFAATTLFVTLPIPTTRRSERRPSRIPVRDQAVALGSTKTQGEKICARGRIC